ncbi:MAG: hypothetical protein ACRENG_24940 [bacterium]
MAEERWRHAKRHRGMSDEILPKVLTTLRESKCHQDKYQFDVFNYEKSFRSLPLGYRKVLVVVKFAFDQFELTKENNFVLSAYLRY